MTAEVIPMLGAVRKSGRSVVKDALSGNPDTLVITQSEMASFMRDPRHWWLSYYRCLRKVYDYPRTPTVGNLYHAGLEALYRDDADPVGVVEAKAKALLDLNLPEPIADDILKAANLAGIMIEGYLEWRDETAADAGLTILGAEQKVEVQLQGTPFILRGKMDARVLVEATGFRAQLEHKSVQGFEDRERYAQSDFQLLTYDLLAYLEALATGDETVRTDGIILNMGRRVKRTARATPPFYKRHEVRHNTQELRSHWQHVVSIATSIQTARQRLDAGESHHVVVPPRVSRESGWSNPFLPVYSLIDDGSDAEGWLAAECETHNPLERYEETEDE
jgi:hypothetical protein